MTDIIVTNDFSCLVYGKGGTGKTIFAGGFPPPIVFVDCDDGMVSLKQTKLLTDAQKSQIHFQTIKEIYFEPKKSTRVQPKAYKKVEAIFDRLCRDGKWEDPETKELITPKTVVLDTLTSFGEFALDDALFEASAINTVKITQPQWGAQLRKITKIIQQGRSFESINFVCLAHEQFQKDENSGRVWCLPLVTGKFASRVGSYFDEYYYADVSTTIKGDEYKLRTRPSGLITARTRLDLPKELVTSYRVLREHLTKGKTNVQNP